MGKLTIHVTGGPDGDTLSSQWGGLSEHLIARFYCVAKGASGWTRDMSDPATVCAPLSEASMEIALNWSSPFEATGAEAKAPMLAAMLQSGEIQSALNAVGGGSGLVSQLAAKLGSNLEGFQGRTGITKLNSTQVFAGMPPVKIQVVALFRAWKDASKEVEQPFNKLMEWALPVELSSDGTFLARLAMFGRGERSAIDVLLPSKAPVCIAMKYKGRIYSPMVIESISHPMASPVDSDGRYVELAIPMTLCTLAAIDRHDWAGSAINL